MPKKIIALKSLSMRLVPIDPVGFEMFEAAARFLKRQLGADAPDVFTLINYQLSNRDVTGIAEDFLDFHDYERERLVFKLHTQAAKPKGGAKIGAMQTAKIVAKLSGRKTAINNSRWADRKGLLFPVCSGAIDPSRN